MQIYTIIASGDRIEYQTEDIMEKLIKEINSLGYSVALRQYNKLKVAGEVLWDATATHIDSSDMRNHPKHVYMDEITFGRSAEHALGKLLEKVKASVAQARQKAATKTYDPFEDEEPAEDAAEGTYEAEGEDAFA